MSSHGGFTRRPRRVRCIRDQRSGECRTIAKGAPVVVEQDDRSVDKNGEERAKMCGRPADEKRCYWTYPGWFE